MLVWREIVTLKDTLKQHTPTRARLGTRRGTRRETRRQTRNRVTVHTPTRRPTPHVHDVRRNNRRDENVTVLKMIALPIALTLPYIYIYIYISPWYALTHCSESRAHPKMVSPCRLLWWLVAQTAVSLWFSSPALVPCLLDFLPMLVQSPTSPGKKREAL